MAKTASPARSNAATLLAKELATFNKLLPTLMPEEGKYALIVGADLVGVYVAYEDALKAGYEKAKLNPFLVKKIAGCEVIAYFSRDINASCLTTPSR